MRRALGNSPLGVDSAATAAPTLPLLDAAQPLPVAWVRDHFNLPSTNAGDGDQALIGGDDSDLMSDEPGRDMLIGGFGQ